MVNFAFLFLMATFVFRVPIKGPFLTLLIGTFVYVVATTGFGQLISSFTRSQVAAVFERCDRDEQPLSQDDG
jgi:ribosome-dependent ATPase